MGMSEDSLVKEIKKEESRIIKQVKKNPWMPAAIILAVVLVIVLFLGNGGASKSTVSKNLLSFIEAQTGEKATIASINESDGMYLVNVNFKGQEVPVYVTKDGAYMVTQPIPLNEASKTKGSTSNTQTQPPANVPKSDKPVVDLFVMSYCPYGTQIEKGILPVAALLKDKADIRIRWVDYAMHGKKEVDENIVQYCIQKEQSTKYLSYLKCFLNASDSAGCQTSTGIDKTKLASCVSTTDNAYNITALYNDKSTWSGGQFPQFNIDKADNNKYGVQGSPTLVINGVQVQSGRDSVSLLKTICSAFNTAPAECNTQLDATTPGPGFGWDSSGSANAAACGV